MGREDHGTGCAAQYIYMTLQHVYAICIEYDGTFCVRQHGLHRRMRALASPEAAADQAGVALRQPAQTLRHGALCKHAVLCGQGKDDRFVQFGCDDGIDRLRNPQIHQPRARAQCTPCRQCGRTGKARCAAQQQELSKIALVRITRTGGEPAPDVGCADAVQGCRYTYYCHDKTSLYFLNKNPPKYLTNLYKFAILSVDRAETNS